jgi:hypothetical protein
MIFSELAAFEVANERLAWPWFAFDASGTRLAYPSSPREIASRRYDGTEVRIGPTFALPDAVTTDMLHGFSIDREGTHVAIAAQVGSRPELFVIGSDGRHAQVSLHTLFGETVTVRAIAYDRMSERIWVSAETETDTLLAFVAVDALTALGIARSPALPKPGTHELYIHPIDDAVLLLAACGEHGTFARVVGWSGVRVETIVTALDGGSIPAGFVGFSADAARVHLAEADELRTHAWPELHELAAVDLADDFVSNFSGAVFGDHVLVDGRHQDQDDEDAVMRFDKSGIRGILLKPPVPLGMWAGRIGRDAIVTVDPKAKPARASILRIALPDTRN